MKDDDPRLEFIIGHALISFGVERAKFCKAFISEDNLMRASFGSNRSQ